MRGYSATPRSTSPPALITARKLSSGVVLTCVGPPEGRRSDPPLRRKWPLPNDLQLPHAFRVRLDAEGQGFLVVIGVRRGGGGRDNSVRWHFFCTQGCW